MRRATNIGAVHRLDAIVRRDALDLRDPQDRSTALAALSEALRKHCLRKAVRGAARLHRNASLAQAAQAVAQRTLQIRTGATGR